jgi:hypothetical protein
LLISGFSFLAGCAPVIRFDVKEIGVEPAKAALEAGAGIDIANGTQCEVIVAGIASPFYSRPIIPACPDGAQAKPAARPTYSTIITVCYI